MRFTLQLVLLGSFLCFQCSEKKDTSVKKENRIMEENRNPGTTSWLIEVPEKHCEYPDHQYCRRPQVEAFCSQASYFAGDTLSIFVSTDPVSSYTIDVYRMGYYDGKGGRLMKSVEAKEGKPQPIPVAGQNNLIECKWDTAYSMTIPEDWISGVYLGKLTIQDSSQSYIVFIIKEWCACFNFIAWFHQ